MDEFTNNKASFFQIGSTVLGYYESNNPFLMVTVPKKYRNTEIHNQLRNKSHQLMTNFDIHATLMDILKLCTSATHQSIT